MIQDPTVNQHQHMIFMLSSMQTYLNQVGITPTSAKFHLSGLFCHFAATSKGVCITPTSVTFRLPI